MNRGNTWTVSVHLWSFTLQRRYTSTTKNSPSLLETGITHHTMSCSTNGSPTREYHHLVCFLPFSRSFAKITCLSYTLDSALIYFVKDGEYLLPQPGTTPDSVTSAVGFNENATLPFQPGKTYRLRIVNTGAFSPLIFWVDGHEMRIIEADGVRLIDPDDL